MVKVSIVVPAFNVTRLLYDCLDSLTQKTNFKDYEIIVIHSKGSFAENCNRGIAASKGEYILLLNDDTLIIENDWLDLLVDVLDNNPYAGAVSPMMLFPSGRVQFAGMVFHPHYMGGHLGFGWLQSDPRLPKELTEFQATTFGCVLLRREALEEVCFDVTKVGFRFQYIDESYTVGGFEDVDWCLRAKRKGWKIYLEPASRLCHLESQTFQKIGNKDHYWANMKLYLDKWSGYFKTGIFRVDDTDFEGGRNKGEWGEHLVKA